jgi:putative transposase
MYPRDMQKEHIHLSQTDYDFLMILVSRGHTSARLFRRATALLELNRGKTLSAVAETLGVSRQSVLRWRDPTSQGV